MNRRHAERAGRRAETIAAFWLRLRGWRILARRVRTPMGEVDLIARRRHMVAFIEVKARATHEEGEWALDRHRLQRVAAAAQAVGPRYAGPGDDVRIDAIFIVPRRLPRHMTNVWHG